MEKLLGLKVHKFPFSMENLPRQTSFACFSLKFGCIFAALLIILYSVLGLAQCIAALGDVSLHLSPEEAESWMTYGIIISVLIVHCVTLILSAIMLLGTLRDKPKLMRPWIIWTSLLVMGYLLLFVFWTTTSMINHSGGNSLLAYAVEFLIIIIRIYLLTLVVSFHKQLEEEMYGIEPLKLKYSSTDTWYSTV